MAEYPLPADTVSAVRAFKRCSNPGLLFHRLAPDMRRAPDGAKAEFLKSVRDCPVEAGLLAAYRHRWLAAVQAARAVVFRARTNWRLIVGLGRKGPLEVGFCFHHLYGFPVIPGSGLKGLARAWAGLVEGREELSPEMVAVFGRPGGRQEEEEGGEAGGALFFDAIPAGTPVLELDIMNPHFPDYYRGVAAAPTDWQSPNPVPFLTVGGGCSFLFAVGRRGGVGEEVQARAVAWLKGGLLELGAGAKTTAGYGYFRLETEPRGDGEAEVAAAGMERPPLERPERWRRGW